MDGYKAPHLCGGILFDLFLVARKPRKKMRNRQMTGTDNLSDVDVYKGLVYVVTGEDMGDYSGGSIRKCVSQYKCCDSSKGSYVPFTDPGIRNAFVSCMTNEKESIYSRLITFKNKYLNDGKCEWLIRAIVDTLQNDNYIDEEEVFEVENGSFIPKKELKDIREFNFVVFIGSVLKYVIDKYPDCESGKSTFLKWYTRCSERSEWKFCSDIGNALAPVKVTFEIHSTKKTGTPDSKVTVEEKKIVSLASVETEDFDEETLMEAKRFCLKYEDEMDLLPLCQIAYDVDPLHRDVRKMYTDYKLSNSKVRRKIMELKEIPILDFADKKWKEKCINRYNTQIHEDGLTTKEFLYEGAKNFHRAYERYSGYEIVDFDPRIFDRPFSGGMAQAFLKDRPTNLCNYIIDFYWYKKEEPEHYVEPPMDYLWHLCDLGGCSENELTYWVCKFIITSSYQMVGDGFPIDEKWCNVSIDQELIHTQEDMYYYALLQLYWLYMIERKTEI
ncbi:MAG: hypothetical protein MJ086_02585 [Lachnospiraceae bacterium]|nr:hypothetical protein [Lachnospiraceae bacterium]